MSLIKSIRLLFLLMLLLVSGAAYASGGGGGGGDEAAEKAKKAEKTAAQKNKKRDTATITGGQGTEEPVYLHLAPIVLPVINDYGAQQIVTMLVDLHMKDYETASGMQKQMPKLKDALFQALYGGLADGKMRNADALDIQVVKDSIKTTLNRVYGADSVIDVYIQAVSQRKF